MTQRAERIMETSNAATWQPLSSSSEQEETVEGADITSDTERNFPCMKWHRRNETTESLVLKEPYLVLKK